MKREMKSNYDPDHTEETKSPVDKLFTDEDPEDNRYEQNNYGSQMDPASFYGVKKASPVSYEAPKDPAFFTLYQPSGSVPAQKPSPADPLKPEPKKPPKKEQSCTRWLQ